MSEITTDYYSDADVRRVQVTAKAAKIAGSGSVTALPWVINEDSLPDELIDSDESTADSSGAPTLRASTDEDGENQIGLHIVDFTPASGGVGGGATAEIWVYTTNADADNGTSVWLWWNKSGKTQPAADAAYGSESVYPSSMACVLVEDIDTGTIVDSTSNGNDATVTGATSISGSKVGSAAISFDGSNDRLLVSDAASLDITDNFAFCGWVLFDDLTTAGWQGIFSKRQSLGTNYGLSLNPNDSGSDVMNGFFYSSGFRNAVTADLSDNFTTATWYHIALKMVDAGSTIDGTIWVNGASVATGSVSGNMFANSKSLDIGATETSSSTWTEWFPGDMDTLWFMQDDLATDTVSTVYQNQNDPDAFWDSTELTESGPFSAGGGGGGGDTASYQWTFSGREYSWTGKIFKDGFAGSTTTVCAGEEMRLIWGNRTNTIDDRVRASEVKFSLFDPDLTVYADLTGEDVEEDDFRLELTDSTGTYTLRMLIRIDETSTLFVDDLEQHITTIYGYCGMAEMQNIDAIILSSSTIHNLFRLCLVSNALAQDIEYLSSHYAENVSTTGVLLDLMRLNRLDLIFAEGGRKVDTMYDQMRSLLEGFQLFAMNGLDGQWHVKHEYGLGETVTDRGGQFYDYSASSFTTLATLTGNVFTMVNRIIGRQTMKRPLRGVQAVQVKRGNARDFFTVDLMKHGDYEEGWVSGTEHHSWDLIEGSYSRSTNSDTGTYAFALASTANRADQELLRFAGGYQDIDVEIALRYALESTSASTTKTGTSFLVLFYSNPTTLDGARGSPGGDWETDPINGAVALSAGVVANGDPLSWTTLITTIYGPLPDFDGVLKISKQSSGASFETIFDTFEVRLKSKDSAKMDFIAVSGRYDLLTGDLISKGRIVEQNVPWYNGLLGLDPTDDGTRDSVHDMVQVLTTPAGSWIQAADFKSLTIEYTSDDYSDIFELTSAIRLSQQSTTTEEIEGEVAGIVPHDYILKYGTTEYIQVYTEIDFKREITSFVAHKKQLHIARADVALITNVWWTAVEVAATAAPESGVYRSSVPADITTVPWGIDAEPSDKAIIDVSNDSADTCWHLVVDPGNDILFYNGAGTFTLWYAAADGSGATNSAISSNSGLGLNRANQMLALCTNTTVEEYDYSSGAPVSNRQLFSSSDFVGCVGYDQSYTYAFAMVLNEGAGSDEKILRITLSDLSTDFITTLPAHTSVSFGKIRVDENAGYIFLMATNSVVLYRADYPGGGNLTTLMSGGSQGTLALDRANRRILISDSDGNIFWVDYDGNDTEEVYDYTSNLEIHAIDTGH